MSDEKSFLAEHFPTLATIGLSIIGAFAYAVRRLVIGPIDHRLTRLEEDTSKQHDSIIKMDGTLRSIDRRLSEMTDAKRQQEQAERMAKAQLKALDDMGWTPPKPK